MNGGGLHHLHLRKRKARGLEPFPARTPALRFLDKMMLVVALLAPIALLPQVFQVYADGNIGGLSIYTWAGLTVVNSMWAFYGFVHRDKPILTANLLIACLDLSIVIGILKYG